MREIRLLFFQSNKSYVDVIEIEPGYYYAISGAEQLIQSA